MHLIFLHGLGQTAKSWEKVAESFPDYQIDLPELFENGRLPSRLDSLKETVNHLISKSDDGAVVIGLSLGAMLALSLLEQPHPNLKGIIACAGQYQFKHNRAYHFQLALFKLFPKFFFKKQGMDKDNLLTFYRGMADFDISEILKETALPCLLICGDKDKVNLKTSQEMLALMPNASLTVLKNTGHESNQENPWDLAKSIKRFLESKVNDRQII